MMGGHFGGQEHLFYAVDLESVIPQKHLHRGIDPELMIRMQVVGYRAGRNYSPEREALLKVVVATASKWHRFNFHRL